MQKHKKFVLSGLTAVLMTVGLLGTTYAYAHGVPGDSSNLVQKIATKFGLKESEVQAVFDQDREARRAEHETQYVARLDQLVTDGKITQEQKTLLLAKHKELEATRLANREKMQSLSASERKAAIEAERTALEEWASSNNIDIKYLMGFGVGKGHGPWMGHHDEMTE